MPIALWHGLQQGPVLDTFNQIVHEWNITHQDQPVETKEYTVFHQPAEEALSTTTPPQIVLAPEYKTSAMMEALKENKIIPISQLFPNEQLTKIVDIVRKTFGDHNGQLVSLPFNPACGVLYANANLVKKMPQTLEELEEISAKLIREGKIEKGYTCAWPPAYIIEMPAAQQDQPLATPANGKEGHGQYQLSANWIYKHLLELRRMQKSGVFVYAGQTNDARVPFVTGKTAFFMQGSTHYPILQKEASFPIIASPLPTLTHGQKLKNALPLGGASIWVINHQKTEEMIEGVRAFLNYLASDEVQEKWHKETAYVPVLKTLPNRLAEFYKDHPIHQAVVSQTIEATLGNHSFGIHMPNYGEARKELFLLIEKVLDEGTSDEDVRELLQAFDQKYSIPKKSGSLLQAALSMLYTARDSKIGSASVGQPREFGTLLYR